MIKVKNLTKIYHLEEIEVHALNSASSEIPKGKMVSIIGKSGSGKSTLLR